MLREDELAFIKATSTLQVSPALLRELISALASRKKRKTGFCWEPQHRTRR
jgi:hypothetical protein